MTLAAAAAARPAGADQLEPLRHFVRGIEGLLAADASEETILREGGALLGVLVGRDDWLPDAYAQPDPERYRQYLLYRDPASRFSVVSFVWAPGQRTPVHDHTVWGLVGVLRGGEIAERYELSSGGLRLLGSGRLEAGAVDAVSPRIGDLHRVSNAADRVTVSIHVYGADIGAVERSTFDYGGVRKPFVSGYAEAPPLIVWKD